jgi:PleD family two-component response regulator
LIKLKTYIIFFKKRKKAMNEIDKESNEILIVDDNPENLRVLSTMLKKE